LNLEFPAKITNVLDFQRKNYDKPPEYVLYGGLLFQPLTSDLMSTYSSTWLSNNRSDILFFYYHAIQNKTNVGNKQLIIFTQLLVNSKNRYAKDYQHQILESINGIAVDNLSHMWKVLNQELQKSPRIEFRFKENRMPLIFNAEDLKKIHQEILSNYSIYKDHVLRNSYEN
jgi:hypothetical protein